jgi:hypothetical protein
LKPTIFIQHASGPEYEYALEEGAGDASGEAKAVPTKSRIINKLKAV